MLVLLWRVVWSITLVCTLVWSITLLVSSVLCAVGWTVQVMAVSILVCADGCVCGKEPQQLLRVAGVLLWSDCVCGCILNEVHPAACDEQNECECNSVWGLMSQTFVQLSYEPE